VSRIRWTPDAANQLADITEHIQQGNPDGGTQDSSKHLQQY